MQNAKKYTSPFGKALYPYLSKADVKFKAEGEYKVDLEVEGEQAEELKTFINNFWRNNFNNIRNSFFNPFSSISIFIIIS